MCGIAGILNKDNGKSDTYKIVHEMCNNMFSRGPDALGVKRISNITLGFRRLSILDLSDKANQPMHSNDKRFTIVFNGEIYNHLEIRNELSKYDIHFKTRSDTETLINGFQIWGEKLIPKLRGMWALAIWDDKKKSLFLSRDRFGQKPLFYNSTGNGFSFASSLIGLKPATSNLKISNEAVVSLLANEYIPNNQCIYEGIKKLAPGHNLKYENNKISILKYWDLNYKEKINISSKDASIELEKIISSSIEEQLVADVPIGLFLSGGIDSGYIAALASKHKPNITSFTMSTPDSINRDESKNAKIIAKRHNLNHKIIPMDYRCMKELPFLLSTMEPFGDSSIIPASAVAKEASKELKVVLSGDGGDEIFGGYGIPLTVYKGNELKSTRMGYMLNLIGPILKYISVQRLTPMLRIFRIHSSGANLIAGSGIKSYFESKDSTPHQVRDILYGWELEQFKRHRLSKHLIENYDFSDKNHKWEGIFKQGIKTRLVDDFLYKVDSATMFNSLEARCPFLDERLIEFISKLPREVLIPDNDYKSLLKKSAIKYNPKSVVYGSKKGFSIPVEKYFLGKWKNLIQELIKDGISAQVGLINPKGVTTLLNKHGLRENYRLDKLLFTILSLEIWLRTFHENVDDPHSISDRLLLDH